MKTPRRVLVIGLRRLGDLLLATALVRSLHLAWPGARIDLLVPVGSEPVLSGNPDVAEIITFQRGRGSFALIRRLFRRYDLAVNLQPEDRGHLLALLAAPQRVGIVPMRGLPGWRWKRWACQAWTPVDLHMQHAVVQYLKLAQALGLSVQPALVPPRPATPSLRKPIAAPYAVVHPFAMYPYKAWHAAGWRAVIAALQARGLCVVITGGPSAQEQQAVADLLAGLPAAPEPTANPVINLAGQLELPELTPLLAGARLFVGPDTSVTHLAAACGTLVVGVFGPSNPLAWGPWPAGTGRIAGSPWAMRGAVQRAGNVLLLQGTQERYPSCIPCLQEGCERRRDSTSDCLTNLEAARVTALIDEILA